VDNEGCICAHCAAQRRAVPAAWIAPVGLAVAFVVFNFVGAVGLVSFRSQLTVFGKVAAILVIAAGLATEAVAMAIWVALGPPPAFRRLIGGTAASLAAAYAVAGPLSSDSGPPADSVFAIALVFVGVYLILTLLLLLVRCLRGWQIKHDSRSLDAVDSAAGQFRIRDLLLAATLLAIALGVGRCIWPPGTTVLREPWKMAFMMPAAAAICAVGLLPGVSAFGIGLARLCGQRRLTAPLASLWVRVDLGLVVLAMYLASCHRARIGGELFIIGGSFRLVSTLLNLAVAAALYRGGYRLADETAIRN
jgi:hypothetical protein